MNLFNKLFKPRWQSSDAGVRRESVDTGGDDALLAALPTIATGDTDTVVRIAALRRAADIALAQRQAHDDASPDVRAAAESLWFDLMSGRHPKAPDVDTRLRLLTAQDHRRLIEHLAEHATEPALRQAALQRVDRLALLVERTLADPDGNVRLAVLERIQDEAQLARIAERSRRSDKQVHRRARERIEAIQLGRGDDAAITTLARELCERLERIVRDGSDAGDLHERWKTVANRAPEALQTRYRRASELLARTHDAEHIAQLRTRSAALSAFDSELVALDAAISHATPSQHETLEARLDALGILWSELDEAATRLRQRESQRLQTLASRLRELAGEQAAIERAKAARDDAERQRQSEAREAEQRRVNAAEIKARRAQALLDIDTALVTLEQTLQAGDSHAADTAHAKVQTILASIDGELPAAAAARVAKADAGYAEISQWKRWAANQRRLQLCDEVEALAASGLHPDAIATRLREAQAEWSTLATAAAGDGKADGLSRRFHAACRNALAPARPYFEKRDELRAKASADIDALLARIGELPDGNDDRKSLVAIRGELTSTLRDIDRLDPRQRKTGVERIRQALTGIDARLAEHDGAIAAARERLIGDAGKLAHVADRRAAMATGRDLQKRWQAIAHGDRRRDEQQWKQFRTAIDHIYQAADAERQQAAQAARQRHDEALTLVIELERLTTANTAPERGSVQRIVDAFSAISVDDAALRDRLRRAQQSLQAAARERRHAAQRARYVDWLEHWRTCRSVERCDVDVETAKQQRGTLAAPAWDAALFDERFHAAASGIIAPSADDDGFRDLLVRIEQLADIETPEQDRPRRRDLQIAQLADKLRGAGAASPEAALHDAMTAWLRLGAPFGRPDEIDQRFGQALLAASERVLGD